MIHVGKQTARLCDAMHRDLPNIGNPARRPFTAIETEAIIRLCQTKSKFPGDVWDRNGTLFAMDLSTALRIEDLLNLKHEHLRWQSHPTRLSVYITDGKTDKFSVGKWTTEFAQFSTNMEDGLHRLRMFVTNSKNTTGFIFRSQGEEHDPNIFSCILRHDEKNAPQRGRANWYCRSNCHWMAFMQEN